MLKQFAFLATRASGFALVFSAVAGSAFAAFTIEAPEIDPGSMMSAMTLFVGCALMLTGKRRKS